MNLYFFILTLVLSAFFLQAEEILLQSGQIVQGRIIGQSSTEIKIETSAGSKSILKSEVIKVKYKNFTEEEKKAYLSKIQAEHARIIAQKKAEQEKKRKEKLKKAQEEKEKKQIDVTLEEPIPTESELIAQEKSKRAAALRELVKSGVMEKPEDEPIEYWDFAWRSLVFPGWGHFKIERPIWGFFYMATSLAIASKIYDTRRIALVAQKENIQQAEINYVLLWQPNLAPLDVRTFVVYNSNAKAALDFQVKVDNYHNSLSAYGLFYTIQFLHIVYNAIAWENGLLIVKKDFQKHESERLTPIFASTSRIHLDGRRENFTTLGVNYAF